ncbi:hypothetical protein C8R27_1255 [Nitrosomonas ureae]|uniref:hypothetical protein n=1 Tax=Nitrosomonas ureae TaxID=44577 RepID=UPI000D764450|nr:hypothetical protein [Nitrosomonas ureae]PXX12352.1 hypothetical protein C8R27_1255 [Nitrosomonas ureae]
MKKLKVKDLQSNDIICVKLLEHIEFIILAKSPDLFFDSVWVELISQELIDPDNPDKYEIEVTDEYDNFISGWPKARVIFLKDYKNNKN